MKETTNSQCLTEDELNQVTGGQAVAVSGGGAAVAGGYPGIYGYGMGYPYYPYAYGFGYPYSWYGYPGYPGYGFGGAVAASGGSIVHA